MNPSHFWLITPALIVVFATAVGAWAKRFLNKIDVISQTLVDHKMQTQRLADQITGIDGKTRDNEHAIAQLIVSTTTLNTVVAEHVKWSDKRDTYLTRELGKKAPKPGRGE